MHKSLYQSVQLGAHLLQVSKSTSKARLLFHWAAEDAELQREHMPTYDYQSAEEVRWGSILYARRLMSVAEARQFVSPSDPVIILRPASPECIPPVVIEISTIYMGRKKKHE
jgi:hypothetical protein